MARLSLEQLQSPTFAERRLQRLALEFGADPAIACRLPTTRELRNRREIQGVSLALLCLGDVPTRDGIPQTTIVDRDEDVIVIQERAV
jgi:hypothetical protein